jgi:hypothetical protein
MAPQAPQQPANTNVGHPVLRQLLLLLVQYGLPLAEAFLASWLASKGIQLPPLKGSPDETPPGPSPGAPISG